MPIDHQQREEERQEQFALRRGGQQRINVMWEMTQACLALLTVGVFLATSGWLVIVGSEPQSLTAQNGMIAIAGIVVGFYFGRTNHSRPSGTRNDSDA